MDSMEEWAWKRYLKLKNAAEEADDKAGLAFEDWAGLSEGKVPSASIIRRYKIWKRKQLRG